MNGARFLRSHVGQRLALGLALCLSFGGEALAQTQTPGEPPADELDALGKIERPQNDAAFDELEMLSGNGDETDPFGDIDVKTQREGVSVTLRALDKITARTLDLEIPIGALATFGSLELVPRYCDKRPPEDFPETTVFVQIYDRQAELNGSQTSEETGQPTDLSAGLLGPAVEGTQIFSGWMFGSSPGLNALEHGVYDVWVIDCKTRIVDQSELADETTGN